MFNDLMVYMSSLSFEQVIVLLVLLVAGLAMIFGIVISSKIR